MGWSIGAVAGLLLGRAAVAVFMRDWGYGGDFMGYGDFLLIFVAGAAGTAIYGLITGTALVFLLRSPDRYARPAGGVEA
jgi:hypothetical protein